MKGAVGFLLGRTLFRERLGSKQENNHHLGGGFKYCIFYFHPYLGKIPILTIFFYGVETTN